MKHPELPWNYNVTQAFRDPEIVSGSREVLIAVLGTRRVRRCVWFKEAHKWSGLRAGETPLAFCVPLHPSTPKQPVVSLPPGVKPVATLPKGILK